MIAVTSGVMSSVGSVCCGNSSFAEMKEVSGVVDIGILGVESDFVGQQQVSRNEDLVEEQPSPVEGCPQSFLVFRIKQVVELIGDNVGK